MRAALERGHAGLLAALCVLGALCALLLFLCLRLRARGRKVERWLEGEMARLHEEIARLHEQAARLPETAREQRPGGEAQTRGPVRAQAASVRPASPPRPAPQPKYTPRAPEALVPLLNEWLAGEEPYNFVETLRAIDPRLPLQRVTPRAGTDRFEKETMLEDGGDALFAYVQGDDALLFPNYGRFSATLDPKPLFEGARYAGRIHSIARPARLARCEGGAWKLREKGRVQMRQG